MNSILKLMFRIWIMPLFGQFVGNSTTILTDMAAAIAMTPSATAKAAATAAAGPMEDIPGTLASILLNFQEVTEKLNYLLGGSAIAPASLTAPTGGIIGSSADSALYNKLVGIFQILQ